MLKKIICAVAAIVLIISASPAVYADQKTNTIDKSIIHVNGYMDEAFSTSGNIVVDQIIKQNGESTTTASINFLYDNEYIYIFGSVDDKTRVSTPPTYDWITDSVEIQLDLDCNPEGQAVGSGYTGLFHVVRYSGTVSIAETSTSPFFLAMKDKIQCAVVDLGENGYQFELAIPHANGFKDAKMGASVIVNDATDKITNLAAMVFMNSTHTGNYNNTKQFYTFTLNSFSNARAADAPTYITSSSPSSTDSSSEESVEETSEETSEVISGGSGASELPKKPTNECVENPFILYTIIGVAALIVIVITVLAAVNRGKKGEDKKDTQKDNASDKKGE